MAFIEEEGRTLDDAVSKALQRIGLPRDAVQVEVLEQRRKLFGLFGTPHAKVRLTYDARSAQLRAAIELLQNLLTRMGIEARVDGVERNGEVHLNIRTDDSGLLIGRRGQTIDALQYLVNRIVKRDGSEGVRIVLDTEHYQERREDRLTRLAQRLAAQVKSTGQAAVMAPLNARDRRIIHLALQADREVSTSSKGDGALRNVLISPRRGERGQRREA
jgi:spoIIIJ-associated protein